MSIPSELSQSEPYSYWYLNSAYIARTKSGSSTIEQYDQDSQKWRVEDRIIWIKWLSEGRRKITESVANKMIAQWAANTSKFSEQNPL